MGEKQKSLTESQLSQKQMHKIIADIEIAMNPYIKRNVITPTSNVRYLHKFPPINVIQFVILLPMGLKYLI